MLISLQHDDKSKKFSFERSFSVKGMWRVMCIFFSLLQVIHGEGITRVIKEVDKSNRANFQVMCSMICAVQNKAIAWLE